MRTQDDPARGKLSDFKRDEMFNAGPERIITVPGMQNTGAAFFSSHIEPDLNDEPHIFSDLSGSAPRVTIEGYTAQVVGGGTQLYGAVSLRFAPIDFQLQTFNANRGGQLLNDDGTALRHVRDWPFTYDTLEPYYAKAEQLIGINGTQPGQAKPFTSGVFYQTPMPPNPISEFARVGMVESQFSWYRTPLAVITEDHVPSGRKAGQPKVGYVNRYGDPLGFKSNTWVALLKPTIADGRFDLEIRPNCTVTHLASEGRRVTAVHYADPSGVAKQVTGKIVVVACSAVESVRLLMLSAENDRNGFGSLCRYQEPGNLLGRFFLTHAFGGAEVAVPKDRYDKSISLDSDYATDACVSEAFIRSRGLWAGGAIYNNTSDQCLPVTLARTHGSTDLDTFWQGFTADVQKGGEEMVRWFDADFGKRLSVSFMANQIPRLENRIELHDVSDKWNRKCAHIIKDWHPHDGAVMGVLADVCRDILLKGVDGITASDISYGSVYGNAVRVANHILGGMRFGTSRDDSVLDVNCRIWDVDNLFVTDGSFMPTSGSANPTLTIQANAFRIADHLSQLI